MSALSVRAKFAVGLAVSTVFFVFQRDSAAEAPPPPPKVLSRLFFQDDAAGELKWADLLSGTPPVLGPVQSVPGFPKLDDERQSLVQMEAAHGFILIGVRDDDDGKFRSGWVLIEAGVGKEEHGDHFHWVYPQSPRVRASVIDDKQGNPAHLYCYDDIFYLANDQRNGFTRFDPSSIQPTETEESLQKRAVFHPGGGNHITLTAVQNRLACSSWIDRDGPNKGRVDFTQLSSSGSPQLHGSLHLKYGGIHGATAYRNRVFLAPSEGICWLDVPAELPSEVSTLPVQYLSLGKVDDVPKRTGAFEVFGNYVAFVSGKGAHAELCLLDADRPKVELVHVPLKMEESNGPAGLAFLQPRRGCPIAVVFHDHPADVEVENKMSVIDLDPDNDRSWSDARVSDVVEVGRSKVQGHAGHHSIAFDADRRRGVFSNPGDGTLTVFDVRDRKSVATFTVGGVPSKVLAIGGRGGH